MNENLVKSILQNHYLSNIKLAIFGLTAAMSLYFGMLYLMADLEYMYVWITIIFSELAIGVAFAFYFEKFFTKYLTRQLLIDFLVCTILGTIGLNFPFFLSKLQDPGLRLTIFALILGVIGAAAFTFSVNRYIFAVSATLWIGPTWIYMVFYESSIPMLILAVMAVVYILVLIFLSYQDYQRQYNLIQTQFNLNDEKERVIESSQKLEMILAEVRKLKTQQDGDYYLTSLLLQPLSANLAQHSLVKIESVLEQKKRFQFRHHERELGGDINIAHNLNLRGRDCIIFLNADAMGKSMQGAGGALVLGAVFQSIIERSRYSRLYKNMYPERWLKNAFIDLHTVFESFDGSMLVSLVLGVLDTESGFLYYINAEHPHPILLRDNRAEFLTDEFYYRKIGTTGVDGAIHIATYHLKPDDILILGSDGRDDIAFGETETGARIINEDETRILTLAEKSKGNLQELVKLIKKEGEITDDLSLMSLKFLGPEKNLTEPEIENLLTQALQLLQNEEIHEALKILDSIEIARVKTPSRLKRIIQQLIMRGQNKKAGQLIEYYSSLAPGDHQAIFAGSVCYFRAGDYEKAADLGERVRMRLPAFEDNLKHLSDVYLRMGDSVRADKLKAAVKALSI